MDEVPNLPPPPPKKAGCLKWVLVCLVVLFVIGSVGGVVLWYLLSRWDSGKSAWEHLPPDVAFAMEVHDVRGFLDGMVADPGLRGVARTVLEEVLPPDVDLDSDEFDLQSFFDLYSSLSPFYTTVLPNTLLMGKLRDGSDVDFLILRSPRWFDWIYWGTPGEYEEITDNSGDAYYLSARDGWAILAFDEEVIELLLDSWDAKAAPFGSGMGSTRPYLLIGDISPQKLPLEAAKKQPEAVAAPPASEEGHFTLRDPFATPVPLDDADDGESHIRVALTREERGWRAWLEILPAGALKGAPALSETVDSALGPLATDISPVASDVELTLLCSDDTYEALNCSLVEDIGSVDDLTATGTVRLGRRFVFDGWLAQAAGGFVLRASRPLPAEAEPYPALPVVSLGWNLVDDVEPGEAAATFASALDEWMDAVKAEGAGTLGEGLLSGVAHVLDADGNAGTVAVPPVLINGARPAWRFTDSMGWLATDPEGIVDSAVIAGPGLPVMKKPPEGTVSFSAQWDVSREFVSGVRAVIVDRLEAMPETMVEDTPKTNILVYMRHVESVLALYPRAVVKSTYDIDAEKIYATMYVPFGVPLEK